MLSMGWFHLPWSRDKDLTLMRTHAGVLSLLTLLAQETETGIECAMAAYAYRDSATSEQRPLYGACDRVKMPQWIAQTAR